MHNIFLSSQARTIYHSSFHCIPFSHMHIHDEVCIVYQYLEEWLSFLKSQTMLFITCNRLLFYLFGFVLSQQCLIQDLPTSLSLLSHESINMYCSSKPCLPDQFACLTSCFYGQWVLLKVKRGLRSDSTLWRLQH